MRWPESDRVARKIVPAEVGFLDNAIKLSKRRLVVQAGGNVGVYPLHLSQYFEHVLTFEPEPANFECLKFNTSHKSNIIAAQAALGDRLDSIGMSVCVENCGAHAVAGGGEIPLLTIDSLNVDCDFIQLDVEGFEINALLGAKETIMACSPVIMIEDNGLSTRYGTPKGAAGRWLEGLGYKLVAGNNTDYIMVRNGANNIH